MTSRIVTFFIIVMLGSAILPAAESLFCNDLDSSISISKTESEGESGEDEKNVKVSNLFDYNAPLLAFANTKKLYVPVTTYNFALSDSFYPPPEA